MVDELDDEFGMDEGVGSVDVEVEVVRGCVDDDDDDDVVEGRVGCCDMVDKSKSPLAD